MGFHSKPAKLSTLEIDVDKEWKDEDGNSKSIAGMDVLSAAQLAIGHILFGNDWYLAEIEDEGIALCRDDNTILAIIDKEGNVYARGKQRPIEEW